MGGVIGAYALYVGSFPIFIASSFISGIYMSAQGFYRFAATDGTTPQFRPKAISYVMSGGLVAAADGGQAQDRWYHRVLEGTHCNRRWRQIQRRFLLGIHRSGRTVHFSHCSKPY